MVIGYELGGFSFYGIRMMCWQCCLTNGVYDKCYVGPLMMNELLNAGYERYKKGRGPG